MSAFEHIIVLLSFVYALAIAHILLTLAGLIRNWERVRVSWLHGFWMANATLVLVVDWISFWDMRALPNYSVPIIFLVLAIGFVDYLQAALVCPEIPADGPIDLTEFHARQGRRYIAAFAASGTMALFSNTVFGGMYDIQSWLQQNVAVVPLLLVAILAATFRRRWIQIAAPLVLTAIWAFYLIDLQAALK